MSRNRVLRDKLEGLAADYYVATLMAENGCLVRIVTEDSTTGTSLHCETDINSRGKREPFRHFWIHVRTGDRVSVIDPGKQASCLFNVRELEYWARQPVPVYAFLIPDYASGAVPRAIYYVNLSRHLSDIQFPVDKGRVTLRSDGVIRPDLRNEFRAFLKNMEPYRESPAYSTDNGEELAPHLLELYVLEPSADSGDRHWWEACEDLRRTAAMAMPGLVEALPQCQVEEAREFLGILRSRLVPVVRLFADAGDQHWETHYALGVDASDKGDSKRAAAHFEKAESFVTLDRKFKSEYPHWSHVVEDIRRRKQVCLAALQEDK
jgi:hypothetical protein